MSEINLINVSPSSTTSSSQSPIVINDDDDKEHKIGIGMDSAVIPLNKYHNNQQLSLVQTIDFFYPLIDNPVDMGRIAFANVVSDLYAIGCTIIDKITLVLSIPTAFESKHIDAIVPLLIDGFKSAAADANCSLKTINNIAENPWCIIGGCATSICLPNEIILPINAAEDDLLILTKPLGTQLATNLYLWMIDNDPKWEKLLTSSPERITKEFVDTIYLSAVKCMKTLNLIAAKLMHKYNAHCATDVTGFGLLGHAKNLCNYQKNKCKFVIDQLPIINGLHMVAKFFENDMKSCKKLLTGNGVETSGGLLIALPSSMADDYCRDFLQMSGSPAWIIGKVEKACDDDPLIDNVQLSNDFKYVDVDVKL